MSTDCAVCYVSDINFLLPTLVSAAGLRKFVSVHKAAVYIFLVDQDESRISDFNRFLRSYDIQIIGMDSRSYKSFGSNKFHNSGIPVVTLGRFFLEGLLPDSCKRIVYIDGDTWIRRDPSALIDAIVPAGKFAAVEDIMSFRSANMTANARRFKNYVKRHGIDLRKNGYFNAGVFAVSRAAWKDIAAEAYKFFLENTESCTYHDQSALNAVVGDRRLRLSMKWNFQTSYRYLNAEQYIEPRIYHFTQYPKPWMGPCKPWAEMHAEYQAALTPLDALRLPIKKVDSNTVESHNKLNFQKNLLLKWPLLSQFVVAYLGLNAYESKAWI